MFIYRAFCRFLCPLGAIYGLFAKIAVVGVKVEAPKCTSCGRCTAQCPMDIRRVGDHECIHCGRCIDVCPTGAISLKAGRITLRGPQTDAPSEQQRRGRRIRLVAWAVALAVLVGALWYFNRPEPATPAPETPVTTAPVEDDTPVGYEVGMRAPDFSVPVYGADGSVFTLSEHRGKPVIVNFWATWCTPCCGELPYFDEIYRTYGNDTAVVAIHSDLVTDDVEAYLANYDYQLPFALDETGSVIQSFGGSTMLPQTIVIDANGIIVYNAVGSVTYEVLENLLSQAEESAKS